MASFLFIRRIVTMIFLDADDKHWLLANSRQELFDLLIARLSPENTNDLYALAAAALRCEEDAIKITFD